MNDFSYVLDCSVAISWIFKDEDNTKARKLRELLLKKDALVPSLWAIEVSNVLWMSEKKKRITAFQSSTYKKILDTMPIRVDSNTSNLAMGRTLELAREYDITVYDACYLELSLRFGIPLATFDKQLKSAAEIAGIPVLP